MHCRELLHSRISSRDKNQPSSSSQQWRRATLGLGNYLLVDDTIILETFLGVTSANYAVIFIQ